MRGLAGVGLALFALPACYASQAISLPTNATGTLILARLRDGLPIRVSAFDLANDGPGAAIEPGDGETFAILNDNDVVALQIAPGPLPINPSPGRLIPGQNEVYRLVDDHFEPVDDGRSILEKIRLAPFDLDACLAQNGCLSEGPGELCRKSCSPFDLRPPAPPIPPLPPVLTDPSCATGERGFLWPPLCRPEPPCPTGWPTAPAGTIYADALAVGGDGTIAMPYGSLQDAITACPSGGQVLFHGTFVESVIVDGGQLTLRGVCPREARVVGTTEIAITAATGAVLEARSFSVDARTWALVVDRGTTIASELTIGGGGGALYAKDSTVSIDTIELSGSTLTAMALESSTVTLTATNLRIAAGWGIDLRTDAHLVARGLRLEGAAAAGEALGVRLGSDLDLEGAVIAGPFAHGVRAIVARHVRLADARIADIRGAGLLSQSSPTVLERLEIARTSTAGVWVVESPLIARDLRIHDVASGGGPRVPAGIRCTDVTDVSITGAAIANATLGLAVTNAPSPRHAISASDIFVEDTAGTAVLLDFLDAATATASLTRVEIRHAGGNGVRLNRFAGLTIEDLRVEDSAGAAVHVQLGLPFAMRRVVARRGTGHGFFTDFANLIDITATEHVLEDVLIEDVEADDNGAIGMLLARGKFSLRRFRVAGGRIGIFTGGIDGSRFTQGIITGASEAGLSVPDALGPELLRQVSFRDNGRDLRVGGD